MRCRIALRHWSQLKAWAIPLIQTQLVKNFAVGNFTGNILKAHPKYRDWHLTLCGGLYVQNSIQTLKSFKVPGNFFDLNPKLVRTFPFEISLEIFIAPLISKLTFDTLLWAREYMQSRSLSSCSSITTFNFSTLYTSIPQFKLKNRLREVVQLCFIQKRMANIEKNTLC